MKGEPSLYVETSRALPLISIAIAVRTGTAADPEGKDGLTRVMARMLRRGCAGQSANEVEERIDSLGAELAIDLSPSMLTIHADVISRSLEPFVDLLARIVAEPSFDEAELGRLLRETQGEIVDGRDNDRALATRHFRRLLFHDHPYGRRSCGYLSTIAKLSRADVQAQYARCFVRGNLAFAFSGDIDDERARAVAQHITSGLPEGQREADGVLSPTACAGRRLVFIDKPARSQTQILVGTVGSHPSDEDHIPMHVATTIFGGTFTSRLMREIRSKRGWSYGASARLPYDRQRDAFTVWTFPAAKDAACCLGLEIDLLQRWRDKGVLPKELAFAKRYLVRSHAFDIDTPNKRVHQRLDVELFDLPADYHTRYLEHVRAVTLDDANQAVARRVSTTDLVIAVVGTHAEIGGEVAAAIPDLTSVEVVPYDAD
jgi:zinc protease